MKIIAIEPTPNPNNMKLSLDESLPEGRRHDFTRENADAAPSYLSALLQIEGVKGLFQVADFIALERFPGVDWRRILAAVREQIETAEMAESAQFEEEPLGRVRVFLQLLRGIPMQVKLVTADSEKRFGLPERFGLAARRVAESANLLAERRWDARPDRYGEPEQVGEEVVAEVTAAYSEERLERLVLAALSQGDGMATQSEPLSSDEVAMRLREPDWRVRYAALDRLEPAEEAFPVITQAVADENPAVRRLAVVYLGQIGGDLVLPHLISSLEDSSATVRRAAGDALSDLGNPAAIGPMAVRLVDASKLVRWRAARYLYEVGDASALPSLRAAANDPEFEVALQVRMAIERIEGGGSVVEPAWKRMTGLGSGQQG